MFWIIPQLKITILSPALIKSYKVQVAEASKIITAKASWVNKTTEQDHGDHHLRFLLYSVGGLLIRGTCKVLIIMHLTGGSSDLLSSRRCETCIDGTPAHEAK